MGSYVARRVLEMIPVLLILSFVVFAVLRILPGDPVAALLGEESGNLSAQQRDVVEHQLGLDDPIPVQYLHWLSNLARGDWGKSLISSQPVVTLIKQRLTVTLQLAAAAWVLALVVGIPVGILSAMKRNTWLDVCVNVVALAGIAVPNFVMGLVLIVVFGVYFHLLPTSGFVSIASNPLEAVRHLALPTVALAAGLIASIVRQTRSAMLEVLGEDYIRTARAKGLRNRRVVLVHGLKNALGPVVTVAGLQVGYLVSGTIIIEQMFGVPGMGQLTINTVLVSDFATVQVIVLFAAVFTMLANLLADVIIVQLDPKIRMA